MWLTASVLAQLVVVAGLLLAVLSLARQVAILHRGLTPAGDGLHGASLLRVGDQLDATTLTTLDGHALPLAPGRADALALLFVSPECPVCSALVPQFYGSREPRVSTLVASGDANVAAFAAYMDKLSIEPGSAVSAPALAGRLALEQLPALVTIGADNVLRTNRPVSSPTDVTEQLAQLAMPSGENST